MTKLSAAQIATYAAGAGFTGQALVDAVAVALAESGGDTSATHTNTDTYRSVDRGLWQINSHWHPEVSTSQAFDPAQAAAAAYRISNGGRSWTAWSTWRNGSAATHIPAATMAAHQVPAATSISTTGTDVWDPKHPQGWGAGPDPGDLWSLGKKLFSGGKKAGEAVTAGGQAAESAVVLAIHAGEWIANPHNWTRVAFVVGGGAALLMGAYMLADSGAAGSIAQGAARTTRTAAKSGIEAAALA